MNTKGKKTLRAWARENEYSGQVLRRAAYNGQLDGLWRMPPRGIVYVVDEAKLRKSLEAAGASVAFKGQA